MGKMVFLLNTIVDENERMIRVLLFGTCDELFGCPNN
jgi:hypothetical protein